MTIKEVKEKEFVFIDMKMREFITKKNGKVYYLDMNNCECKVTPNNLEVFKLYIGDPVAFLNNKKLELAIITKIEEYTLVITNVDGEELEFYPESITIPDFLRVIYDISTLNTKNN